jgi:hypothetical protein
VYRHFHIFSTVTRYVTCYGPRLSNVPDGEHVVFTVVPFPLHLLSSKSYNSSFASKTQNKGDGLCIAVGLHSDSKQRGYVFVLFSCNLSRRVAFVQTWIFTQTPNAVYFRISVSASCNNRQRGEAFCYVGFHSDS